MTQNNFFRDSENTIRLTGSGVNCYTVIPIPRNSIKLSIMDKLKQTIVPYKKNIHKCTSLNSFGNDIVNECIKDIKKFGIGYVFNQEQLHELIRIIGFNYTVTIDDYRYYIKKIN